MASSLRCTFLSWRISWYCSFQNGISVNGPTRQSCYMRFLLKKAALDIFKDAINKMVDKACDEDTEQAIRECAEKQPGVIRVDMLKTRVFGNKIYVDLEIGADGNETLAMHMQWQSVYTTILKRNFQR